MPLDLSMAQHDTFNDDGDEDEILTCIIQSPFLPGNT